MDWTRCPAVNGIEPRNCCNCRNLPKAFACWKAIPAVASWRAIARRPGVEGPFALHMMSTRQPVRSQWLLRGVTTSHVIASMLVQAEEARIANGAGKSEGCVVPMKLGNSGGGKAAERWRHLEGASSGHSARPWMLTRFPLQIATTRRGGIATVGSRMR